MEPSNVYVTSNSTEMGIGSQENVKNPSLICAPVMADSIDKMVTETCKAHELGVDLVEIRLDWLKDFIPLEDLKSENHYKEISFAHSIHYRWVTNHYRWIVWKLACYEIYYPAKCKHYEGDDENQENHIKI